MDEVLFAFEDVTVAGSLRPRLDGISMKLPPEGVTVIVGPSGSGKTTLLRLCNRLDVPTSGRVLFRGTDVAVIDPLRLRRTVGMVFQQPTLFGGTVRDNLRVAAPDASDGDFRAALDGSRLDPSFLEVPAEELSGGEAQRACLARTLAAAPSVLLMDEPTASLDARPAQGLERLTLRLAEGGFPVLWATHDLLQARRIAGHLIVLLDGRIRAQGSPSDVEGTADREVLAFLEAGTHGG